MCILLLFDKIIYKYQLDSLIDGIVQLNCVIIEFLPAGLSITDRRCRILQLKNSLRWDFSIPPYSSINFYHI